jgi:hypothetical protein
MSNSALCDFNVNEEENPLDSNAIIHGRYADMSAVLKEDAEVQTTSINKMEKHPDIPVSYGHT